MDNPPRAPILSIPNECIRLVLDELEGQGFLNARLACKHIQQNSIKVFIKRYISELRLVVTEHSLAVLFDITSDATFGPEVKSIVLNSALCVPANNQFGHFNQLLLAKSFEYIKAWRCNVVLGIADVHLRAASTRGEEFKFSGAAKITYAPHQSPSDILEFALKCIKEASCELKELKLIAVSDASCRCGTDGGSLARLRNLIYAQLRTLPKLSFHLRLFNLGSSIYDEIFFYNYEQKAMGISRFSIKRKYEQYSGLVQSIIMGPMSNRVVHKLDMEHLTIYSSEWYRHFIISPHRMALQSIDYQYLKLAHRSNWCSDIKLLSRIPNLHQCSLKYLSTTVPSSSGWDNFGDADIENDLFEPPSGIYASSWILEMSGSEVSSALKVAADLCKTTMRAVIACAREDREIYWLEHERYEGESDEEEDGSGDGPEEGPENGSEDNDLFNLSDRTKVAFEEAMDELFRWTSDSDSE